MLLQKKQHYSVHSKEVSHDIDRRSNADNSRHRHIWTEVVYKF